MDIFNSELCISRVHGLRESQFSSSILRICFCTMRMPFSAYDYDMNTGISVLKKKETVSNMRKFILFVGFVKF